METPNDIDLAIYEAKLEGMDAIVHAAVWAQRQRVLDTLCGFVREFVSGAATLTLEADVDWRWAPGQVLDADGNAIATDEIVSEATGYSIDDFLSELFLSRVSEFPDWGDGHAVVDLVARTFTASNGEGFSVVTTDPEALA